MKMYVHMPFNASSKRNKTNRTILYVESEAQAAYDWVTREGPTHHNKTTTGNNINHSLSTCKSCTHQVHSARQCLDSCRCSYLVIEDVHIIDDGGARGGQHVTRQHLDYTGFACKKTWGRLIYIRVQARAKILHTSCSYMYCGA